MAILRGVGDVADGGGMGSGASEDGEEVGYVDGREGWG